MLVFRLGRTLVFTQKPLKRLRVPSLACRLFSLSPLFMLRSNRLLLNLAASTRSPSTIGSHAKKYETVGKYWIVVAIYPPIEAKQLLQPFRVERMYRVPKGIFFLLHIYETKLDTNLIVVVAEKKSQKQWARGSCVYLTVEEQQCLGFGIVPLIPFKTYTRKNIVYLQAIKQGVTTVLGTDSNQTAFFFCIHMCRTMIKVVDRSLSLPLKTRRQSTNKQRDCIRFANRQFLCLQVPTKPNPGTSLSIHTLDDRTCGHQDSHLQTSTFADKFNNFRHIGHCPNQSLADLDLDVDAIFRLTQGQEELKQIKYYKESPSIRLAPGALCPFNSNR